MSMMKSGGLMERPKFQEFAGSLAEGVAQRDLAVVYGVRSGEALEALLQGMTNHEYDQACTGAWMRWGDLRLQYVPDKFIRCQGYGQAVKVNCWESFLEGAPDGVDLVGWMQLCCETERQCYQAVGLPWKPALAKWHSVAARAEQLLLAEHFLDVYPKHEGLAGYFGPRIEQGWQGIYDGPIWSYDIHSAYPYAMMHIYPFTGALQPVGHYMPTGVYGFYLTRWDLRALNLAYYPFPVRTTGHDGSDNLIWPARGEAWVSNFELQAWSDMRGGDMTGVQVGKGYVVPHSDTPSRFQLDLPIFYAQRLAAGEAAPFVKHLLTATYGKTIQQAGRSAAYNPFYAALVTAYTRAQLLPHLNENVISILSDNIITRAQDPTIDVGDSIGQWDCTQWSRGTFVKPGIYELNSDETGRIQKLRGFQDPTCDCEQEYRHALQCKHFDLHIRIRTHGRTRKLCVQHTLRLPKRQGKGFWRHTFGAESLTYYAPVVGTGARSKPYRYQGGVHDV